MLIYANIYSRELRS